MKRLFTLVLCLAFAVGTAEAKTYYVNAKRPNNNGNGLKPSTAKKTIQAAINLARAGDTILVYPGEYAPIKTNDKKITIKSVKGRAETKIIKPTKAQDLALAQLGKTYTIKSTSGSYSSAPLSKGSNTTLTGFLLDGRYRSNSYYDLIGVSGGKATSCTIQRLGRTTVATTGGTTYSYNDCATAAANARLTSCILKNNKYVSSGWGLLSDSTLLRCQIQSNSGLGYGSGQGIANCNLYSCLLTGNTSDVSLFSSSSLLNCTIAENAIVHDGKTMRFSKKSKYWNCILRNNTSQWKETVWKEIAKQGYWDENGDWIDGQPGTVVGFYDDEGNWHLGQPGEGDGSWASGTWQPYEAVTRTAGYFVWDGYWEEYSYETRTAWETKTVNHAKKVHNTDSGNTYSRTFQTNKDPKFAKGSYKLAKGSPCINQGSATAAQKKSLGSLDLGGGKRIKGKAIDMGCYEY